MTHIAFTQIMRGSRQGMTLFALAAAANTVACHHDCDDRRWMDLCGSNPGIPWCDCEEETGGTTGAGGSGGQSGTGGSGGGVAGAGGADAGTAGAAGAGGAPVTDGGPGATGGRDSGPPGAGGEGGAAGASSNDGGSQGGTGGSPMADGGPAGTDAGPGALACLPLPDPASQPPIRGIASVSGTKGDAVPDETGCGPIVGGVATSGNVDFYIDRNGCSFTYVDTDGRSYKSTIPNADNAYACTAFFPSWDPVVDQLCDFLCCDGVSASVSLTLDTSGQIQIHRACYQTGATCIAGYEYASELDVSGTVTSCSIE